MDYSVHIDEFGYLVVIEQDGKSTRIALTRSSLLELHAQAFDAALHAPFPPEEKGPLRVVEP